MINSFQYENGTEKQIYFYTHKLSSMQHAHFETTQFFPKFSMQKKAKKTNDALTSNPCSGSEFDSFLVFPIFLMLPGGILTFLRRYLSL